MNEHIIPDKLIDGYRLTHVYQRLTPDDTEAITQLWLQAGVVAPAEAQRRVHEVVYTAHNPQGELIGVNTVYVGQLPGLTPAYYFYRTFLRAGSRGRFGIPREMLRLAIKFLRTRTGPESPVGLIVVTENPKLMRRSTQAILHKLGLTLLGQDARGCDVWGIHFDGSPFDRTQAAVPT